MFKRLALTLVTLSIVLAFLCGGLSQAYAQNPQPLAPGRPPAGPQNDMHSNIYQNAQGIWLNSGGRNQLPAAPVLSPNSIIGPDDYGYTLDNAVPLSWVNATGGTIVTGMSGDSFSQKTGPIALPFPFKFYENSYTSLYIAASGYLSFVDQGDWRWQPEIPSPALPNDLIAPYASPLSLAASGTTNRIYYSTGGTAPNRYFVVEWYQVKFNDETYTFEAILYENGDIGYQYQQMTYKTGYACGSAGIEDSYGTTGLANIEYCSQVPSNTAVRFFRPSPMARVNVTPRDQGRFAHAGENVLFPITVRNNGDLGADTYDISFSPGAWPVSMYAGNGTEKLVDTDLDGKVDTGQIPQGGQISILAAVQMAAIMNVGESNNITILFTSSVDTLRSKEARLQVAIPASFTQVFTDTADGAMSIRLVRPDKQEFKNVTPVGLYGNVPSVTAKSDGYIYMWAHNGYNGKVSYENIEYSLLDMAGNVTRPVSKLTDNSAATSYNTYDFYPEMAVAANGRIGIVWTRKLWNSSTGKAQYNTYFTVIDPAGNLVFQPVNLTNNTAWGGYSDLNVPRFYSNHIVATQDNRFVIAWVREHQENAGWKDDLYYVIKDSNGGSVKPLTKFTNGVAGGDSFYSPSLTMLSNNQIFMAWTQYASSNYSNAFAVLDSSGGVVHAATPFDMYAYMVDAVELAGGKILIAGREWEGDLTLISYSILDRTDFSQIVADTPIHNPYSVSGDYYVSVTADAAGRGILTWMEYDYDSSHRLYYALIDNNGSLICGPMIFQSSQAGDSILMTNYYGNGNTTNKSIVPTTPDVDLKLAANPSAGGAPGGNATMPVTITNLGVKKATAISLTATLPEGVTLAEASPVPDTNVGGVLTWAIPDLSFLGSGRINLTVALPSSTVGTLHPISWSVNSAGPEANPADNAVTINVMESLQLWLPAILR